MILRMNPSEEDREQVSAQGAERAWEAGPTREAQDETSILADADIMLLQIQVALKVVEERYTPLYTAMRGLGNVLRSKDVEEYPEMVKKLRKEEDRTRKELAKATMLILEQKNEQDRKKKHF
jgi:hypothetical protein